MSSVAAIVGYGFREAVRRKVFAVVVLLTALFLFLFWLANHYVFGELSQIAPPEGVNVDTRTFAGAFLFGLAMFATLFLGVVLAVFLTLGVVSGDAERGLLQPLVVRPIGRGTLLLSRFLGAAGVTTAYVLAVYWIAMTITGETGRWWPAAKVVPGLGRVTKAGGLLFVNSVGPVDPETGRAVSGDTAVQTAQSLRNLKTALEEAGSSLERGVWATWALKDPGDFDGFCEEWSHWFPEGMPVGQGMLLPSAQRKAGFRVSLGVIAEA